MRFAFKIAACALLCAIALFAQTGSGTITGTISDPAGAVVPNAPVEMKNTQTSAVYTGASSGTGNYTIAELPVETCQLSIKASGFEGFVQENIVIPASQTIRVDAALQVGAASEESCESLHPGLDMGVSPQLRHGSYFKQTKPRRGMALGDCRGAGRPGSPILLREYINRDSNYSKVSCQLVKGGPLLSPLVESNNDIVASGVLR